MKDVEYKVNELLYQRKSKKIILKILELDDGNNEIVNLIKKSPVPHIFNFKYSLIAIVGLLLMGMIFRLFFVEWNDIENLFEILFYCVFSIPYIVSYFNLQVSKNVKIQKISFYSIFFFQCLLFTINISLSIYMEDTDLGFNFISIILFYYFVRAYIVFPKYLVWIEARKSLS